MRGCAPGRFELGIAQVHTPTETLARTYDAERCLCDLLRARRSGKADLQLFYDALHAYMKSAEKNLSKVARYAREFGVTDELRDVMEVLG